MSTLSMGVIAAVIIALAVINVIVVVVKRRREPETVTTIQVLEALQVFCLVFALGHFFCLTALCDQIAAVHPGYFAEVSYTLIYLAFLAPILLAALGALFLGQMVSARRPEYWDHRRTTR